MKTNVFVKLAVVAMAAFGAFAFNGEKQAEFFIHDGDECEDTVAPCSVTGDNFCKLEVDSEMVQVWSDLNCSVEAYYKPL